MQKTHTHTHARTYISLVALFGGRERAFPGCNWNITRRAVGGMGGGGGGHGQVVPVPGGPGEGAGGGAIVLGALELGLQREYDRFVSCLWYRS